MIFVTKNANSKRKMHFNTEGFRFGCYSWMKSTAGARGRSGRGPLSHSCFGHKFLGSLFLVAFFVEIVQIGRRTVRSLALMRHEMHALSKSVPIRAGVSAASPSKCGPSWRSWYQLFVTKSSHPSQTGGELAVGRKHKKIRHPKI